MGGEGVWVTEKSIKKFEMFLMYWSSNLYFADQCNIIIIF